MDAKQLKALRDRKHQCELEIEAAKVRLEAAEAAYADLVAQLPIYGCATPADLDQVVITLQADWDAATRTIERLLAALP